jgi:hypothetical protein
MKVLAARYGEAVFASPVSETVGAGALIGVPVSHFKKSPAWEGSPTRGQGALLCSRGEAR